MSYFCKICDYKSKYKSEWSLHNYSIEHIKKCNNINTNKFICEVCDFVTSNKKDYTRHLKTIKHFSNDNQCFSMEKKPQNSLPFACSCGKAYKDNSGLWRHKKKCSQKPAEKEKDKDEVDITDKNLMLTLITQNNELQKQMLDIIKSGTVQINN